MSSPSSPSGPDLAMPPFIPQVQNWLDGEGHDEVIQQMRKETALKEFKVRQFETARTLELQASLRPKLKDIPGFWPFTLTRNQEFARLCSSLEDLDAISYLEDVELKTDAEDPRAYEIVMYFAENPYFSNSSLTKSYTVREPENAGGSSKSTLNGNGITDEMLSFNEDELVPQKTTIDWKSDEKNLCLSQPRNIPGEDDDDDEDDFDGDAGSFFHWFADSVDHFSLGPLISAAIIPEAVDTFLGLADGCDSDSDSDDDSEEDEDDLEDADEIDLEAEENRPKKKARLA